ncbi:hypothetical protein [Actinomadura sp. 9N407]|uniref:hypothetical protein n=1 Tax=Actinomadura sp. 9N407 TaxID=3375154 RepID=UPI0037993535
MLAAIPLLAGVVIWMIALARRWTPRLLVGRASLKNDGLGSRVRLIPTAARLVLPVHLAGVGGAGQRFDLSLIDVRPDTDLCGIRAGELSELRDRNLFMVLHPVYLELWLRSGRSYRRAAALPWTELHRVRFIAHDPDGIGVVDDRYRGSVGTLQASVSEGLHLYLLVRVKPAPALLGPGSTSPNGFG